MNNKTYSGYNKISPVYQSANSDDETIKKNFIVRKTEFRTIINALDDKSENDSLQHELILGRRGSGKSTLLKRIEVEIKENSELREKYISVSLAEEQAGIYRLFDLWEQVICELSSQSKQKISLKDYFDFSNEQEYTRYLYDIIHEMSVGNKKKIVLLLDNFDRIVENFTDDGHLLREILINYNDIVLITASTRMDEYFWQYDKPFYEFFRKHWLEGLSRDETFELLEFWSDSLEVTQIKDFIKQFPGKVENIRLLTDGLPRTMRFFMEIILHSEKKGDVDFLKKIMDEATPQYQERLNYLTPQLRKIVLEMAFIWEACSTRQLVEKCRMESKLISANLKTLTSKGFVETIPTNKKNNLYRISERFFNMWLIVTQGNPEQKRKVRWLSIFLENWYDANEFLEFAQKHIDDLKEKELNSQEAGNVKEPKVHYLPTVKKKNDDPLWNYYINNRNKEKAKEYIEKDDKEEPFSVIKEMWCGVFNDVENRVFKALSGEGNDKEQSSFITRLLVHNQNTLVYKAFNHPEFGKKLQDKYKVLYYTCLILNDKKEDNLLLKIPPELEMPVKDVLKRIEDLKAFYRK